MHSEVRTMLDKTYALFLERCGEKTQAWDQFIEFLAADHNPLLMYQLNHKFEWLLKSDLSNTVADIYDPCLLKADVYDHLGDMYLEKIATSDEARDLERLLRPTESYLNATVKLFGKRSKRPESILDPEAGTGRWLMAVHSVSPDAKLFGVERNLRLYRIAYTNLAIRGIKAYLLHADQQNHQIDIATKNGEHNWEFANVWNPCQDKLKPITDPKASPNKPQSTFKKT